MITVEILEITDNTVYINWSENGEFGNIKVEYNGKGGFDCDCEYIGIKRFLKIMKNLPSEFNNPDNGQ